MSDVNNTAAARAAYETLCAALDENKWHYKKDDDRKFVTLEVNGDDLPIRLLVIVEEEKQLVYLRSELTFKFPDDRRIDGAIACCLSTYKCGDGSFDYDLSTGTVAFRLTSSFRGNTVLGKNMFHYMLGCACSTVDEYNDKLFALSKGLITIEDFIKKV